MHDELIAGLDLFAERVRALSAQSALSTSLEHWEQRRDHRVTFLNPKALPQALPKWRVVDGQLESLAQTVRHHRPRTRGQPLFALLYQARRWTLEYGPYSIHGAPGESIQDFLGQVDGALR